MKRLILLFVFLILIIGCNNVPQVESQIVDPFSRAEVFIAWPHSEIHEGDHFQWEGGISMGSGDTTLLVFDINNTNKAVHMLYEIYGLTAYTLDIFIGGDYIRAPDAITPFNNNQRSTNTSGLDTMFIVYNDSTLISRYGTSIFPTGPISVGTNQKIGTVMSRDHEIIWPLDSLVIFKLTSDAASNKLSWDIPWYEHTQFGF